MNSFSSNYSGDTADNVVTNRNASNLHELIPSFRIINLLMLLITIWILISLITFGKLSGKLRPKKEEGKLFIYCIIAIFLIIPRLLIDQLRFDAKRLGGGVANCELMSDMSDIAYGIALYGSYFCLWMRQRMIYASPCLKALHGVLLTACSWIVISLITAGTVAAVVVFAVPPAVRREEYGCVEIQRENYSGDWDKLRNYVIGGGVMVAQLMLLGLFVIPMIKIQRFSGIRSRDRAAKSTISKVVRRAFYCTCVAIASDIIAALLVTETMPDGYYVIVGDVIYNVAAFIDAFCVVSTLGQNRRIATVFCCRCIRKKIDDAATRTGCQNSSFTTKQTYSENLL